MIKVKLDPPMDIDVIRSVKIKAVTDVKVLQLLIEAEDVMSRGYPNKPSEVIGTNYIVVLHVQVTNSEGQAKTLNLAKVLYNDQSTLKTILDSEGHDARVVSLLKLARDTGDYNL